MPTYNGSEPYIFISYAHKDRDRVLPIIEGLQARGFRVWFDEGIEAGSEWPEYIADRLCDSACVLAFITEAAVASHNCRREINFAIDEKKEMLVVYLEALELSRGMRMQLGTLQAIFRTRFASDSAFLDELCDTPLLASSKDDAAPRQTTPSAEDLYAEAEQLLDNENYAAAVELLKQLAKRGHTDAQNRLGWCYAYGRGVLQNYTQAVHWYTQAAEAGHAEAQYNLGRSYEHGRGVGKNHIQAARWYAKAAELGHAEAQCMLGECYYDGRGIQQDYRQAAMWYINAAEQGFARAQFNLGMCYEYGWGVSQDRKQAVYWLSKAAEQGDKDAQNALAHLR